MTYFDNCSTSYPKAPGVSQAVASLLERGCFNVNRGEGAYEMSALVFDTREKLAAFFGAPSGKHVVFTGGATMSINMALKGLLRPGDRVVATQMEHNAVVRPLAQLSSQGVLVDFARCFPDGKLDLADIERKVTAKTKLVVMTHASNVCGVILPVREVGGICRARGVKLLVDSAQTAGVLPISMERDNIDILAFAGHKGLLAAAGIGGLVLSQDIAGEMAPLIAGGTGSYSHIADMPRELPDRLEPGTINLPGVASLHAALTYIKGVGVESIYTREMELMQRLTQGVKEMPGVRIAGPDSLTEKCAVAALDFTGYDNAAIAARLSDEYSIITRCGLQCAPMAHKALGTFPNGVIRVSLGHKNTESEIDGFLSALRSIMGV